MGVFSESPVLHGVCVCVCLFTAKMSAADLPWFAGVPSLPALYREREPDVSSHDGC